MKEPLLGLDAWPGVAADYDVFARAGKAPVLRLQLAFDAAGYSPDAAPADAGEPPAWQLAALQALPAYDLLADQLPTATVAYASSLLPEGEVPLDAALHASLLAWLFGDDGVRAFLRARSEGDAARAAPPAWTLEAAFTCALAADAVFELSTSITVSRPQEPADADALEDVPQASGAARLLAPREEGDGLAGFARRIEACLSSPGVCVHKLAASVDATGGLPRAGRTRLWLVRIGLADGQAIRLRLAGTDGPLAGDPLVFAPRPLYPTPQSRTGVPFYDYVPGKGIDLRTPGGESTLNGIDAEAWLRGVVTAVDAADVPDCAAELQQAKQQLAQALSQLVVPVFADQAPSAAQRAAAQEAFRQQALRGLAAAHASDAVVQFATQVTATDATLPRQLVGSLLPGGGCDPHALVTQASLPLRQTPSGATTPLSFLVTAAGDGDGDGVKPKAVTLELTFRPLHIQAGSSWLFFVLPPEAPAGEGPLDVCLGSFSVPIALRGLPMPPAAAAQEAVTHEVRAPGGWTQVAQALKWDLRFAWQDMGGHPQDTMHYTARFNAAPGDAAASGGAPADAADPLPALFAFVHAYPQLQADLQGTPAPLAQRAFVQLVRRVAQALSAFVAQAPAGLRAAAPDEAQGSVPAVQRSATIAGLDAVAVQSARTWLAAERNQWLLPGRPTAQAFVLRTATVDFTAAVRPLVRIAEPVDLASVGGDAPVARPLGAQLDNLLSVLFAHAPAAAQTVQVAAVYVVGVDGAPPGVTVSLPVFLMPPMPFQPKRAASTGVPGPAVDACTQDEFVAGMQNTVRGWFTTQQPQTGGDLVFTLTAFNGSAGADPSAPLLVLDALTLRHADWSDRPAVVQARG